MTTGRRTPFCRISNNQHQTPRFQPEDVYSLVCPCLTTRRVFFSWWSSGPDTSIILSDSFRGILIAIPTLPLLPGIPSHTYNHQQEQQSQDILLSTWYNQTTTSQLLTKCLSYEIHLPPTLSTPQSPVARLRATKLIYRQLAMGGKNSVGQHRRHKQRREIANSCHWRCTAI